MLQNYFKTAWRSLLKGKSFSLINIAGLAVGMAASMLILLWIQHEISFDEFHANKNNLYEVYALSNKNNGPLRAIDQTSQPLGPALKLNYPEVENATRVTDKNGFLLTAGNKSFTTVQGCLVDPSFLQLFSFPLIEGIQNEQLQNVYSITITQSLAKKLFGNEKAMGKTIKIDSVDHFTVTGILKDLPSNTRFDFDYLLPWSYYDKLGHGFATDKDAWMSNNTSTFIQLKPNTNVVDFNQKIKDLTNQTLGRTDLWTHFIYPLPQWHLYSKFENGVPLGGRIDTVRVFGMIALFILLIACINFMNLSTASSEKRAKEVGIRKVVGSSKAQLITQFITEAFLTTVIAGATALVLVQLVLPAFNTLIGTQLTIPYSNPYFWSGVLGFILITSLLAGSYPAFYLSAFNPLSIFKKQFKRTQATLSPRKLLVVLQFTFAIILIIATLIIHNQVVYTQDRDKGYSDHNLIQVNFAGQIDQQYDLIKQDLLRAGIASAVTKTMHGITESGYHSWGLRWPNEKPVDTTTTLTIFSADADLMKTTGMQLIEGRDIDIKQYPADSFSILLNESAVRTMGLKDPIGQTLYNPFDRINWHVVGVVNNYIQGSPYDDIPPTVIYGPGAWFNMMYIKLNPAHSTAAGLSQAETIFKTYNPSYPFDYQFVDDQYARQFDNEQRTKTMVALAAGLAIFISCLGLFGLSAFLAESRIKEIGVRKVLGATVFSITRLLSLDFIKLVLLSAIIATPVAYLVMSKWLQGYSYRIPISWGIFMAAGITAIAIALATVSFQSIKAAIANPVKSLRTE